jgi:hypothetical protein
LRRGLPRCGCYPASSAEQHNAAYKTSLEKRSCCRRTSQFPPFSHSHCHFPHQQWRNVSSLPFVVRSLPSLVWGPPGTHSPFRHAAWSPQRTARILAKLCSIGHRTAGRRATKRPEGRTRRERTNARNERLQYDSSFSSFSSRCCWRWTSCGSPSDAVAKHKPTMAARQRREL